MHYSVIITIAVILLELLLAYSIKHVHFRTQERVLLERVSMMANGYQQVTTADSTLSGEQFLLNSFDASEGDMVEVLDLQGNILLSSSEDPLKLRPAEVDWQPTLPGETSAWQSTNAQTGQRVLTVAAPLFQGDQLVGILRYTRSLEPAYYITNTIIAYAVIMGLFVILLAPGLCYPLSQRFLAPIDDLTLAAEKLANGERDVLAPIHRDLEIDRLAKALNNMSEQVDRTEKTQNEFISSISHELRTPLTSIKGWGETLVSGGLEDKEEGMLGLDIILKETDRMIGLVEDLLDFSHLQAGRISLNREAVSINQIVGEVHDLLSIKAAKKSIGLAMELGGSLPEISGDGNRLKQVLLNLLDNSLKFTPIDGLITIRTSRQGDWIEVAVIDTGTGIAAKDMPYILGKFVKGDNRAAGSGIGLSIANEIVTLHGGELLLESEEGKGTTAVVRLPITEVEDTTSETQE